jgi:hypothetical protein
MMKLQPITKVDGGINLSVSDSHLVIELVKFAIESLSDVIGIAERNGQRVETLIRYRTDAADVLERLRNA